MARENARGFVGVFHPLAVFNGVYLPSPDSTAALITYRSARDDTAVVAPLGNLM